MTRRGHRRSPLVVGRVVAVGLIAAALLLLPVVPVLPGSLGGGFGGGLARRADAQSTGGEPRLALVEQSSWVAPTGAFTLRFRPENIPPTATVTVQVRTEVDGRIRFERSIAGEGLGAALRPGPAPITLAASVPLADGSHVVTIPVSRAAPAPAGGVVLAGPGVYPVTATVTDADGRELTRLVTHLVRLPTADTLGPSLAVGPVVPLDGRVVPDQEDTTVVDPTTLARVTGLVRTLASWPTVPLAVDPTPALLRALADDPLGATGVATLAAHLGGRQVLASPYVGLDTGAWVASGLGPELDIQLAAGATTTAQTLGGAPDGRVGVADPTLTPDALATLRRLGLDRVLVPTDQLGPLPGDQPDVTFTRAFDVTDGDGQTLRAITADQTLTAHLRNDDPVLGAHLVLADLAILYGDEPGVARGVGLDVGPDVDPVSLGILLSAFTERIPPGSDARPVVSPVTLDDLFRVTDRATVESRGRETTVVRTYRSPPPGDLGAYPSLLRATRTRVDGYRSLTSPVPGAAEPMERDLLLSGAADLDAGGRAAVLGGIDARIDAATAEVVAPLQQFVTLTSRAGKIPLNLENRLPYPVRVNVVLTSAKLEFPDGEVIDVVLDAATTTRLDVAVTTRASGAFPLEVAVQSPDGVLALTSTRFTVRSTAVSGVGLLLSVGAGLFLLVWWGRHFRKVRRARRLVATEPDPETRPGVGPAPDPGGRGGYAPPTSD